MGEKQGKEKRWELAEKLLSGISNHRCTLAFLECDLPDKVSFIKCELSELRLFDCQFHMINLWDSKFDNLQIEFKKDPNDEMIKRGCIVKGRELHVSQSVFLVHYTGAILIDFKDARIGRHLQIKIGNIRQTPQNSRMFFDGEQIDIGGNFWISLNPEETPKKYASGQISLHLKNARIVNKFVIAGKTLELVNPGDIEDLANSDSILDRNLLELVAGFNIERCQIGQIDFANTNPTFFDQLAKAKEKAASNIDLFEAQKIIPPWDDDDSDNQSSNDPIGFFKSMLALGSKPNNKLIKNSPGSGNYLGVAKALSTVGYNRLSDDLREELAKKRSEGGKARKGAILLFVLLCIIFYLLIKINREEFKFRLEFFDIQFYGETIGIFLVLVALSAFLIFIKKRRPQLSDVFVIEDLFNKIYGTLFRHGLSPLRSISLLCVLAFFGGIMFSIAESNGIMTPTIAEVYHIEHDLHAIDDMITYHQLSLHSDTNSKASASSIGRFYRKSCVQPISNILARSMEKVEKMSYVGFYRACRLNWANPNTINNENWGNAFKTAIDHQQWPLYKKIMPKIDRKCICEAFLPAEHSKFSPFIYSLDITIPLLDLRQEGEWAPSTVLPNTGKVSFIGYVVVILESILILAGWLMAIVFAAAITGLSDPTRPRF